MNNSQKLKIGLDYHGVIDQNPLSFARFCDEGKQRGHKIHIITGGPKIKIEEYLRNDNIKYDTIFAISDYYQALGQIGQSDNGIPTISEDKWNRAKAEYCRRNKIDFHIDDSVQYMQWFSTPFCLYEKKQNKCTLFNEEELDFNQSADRLWQKLEQIIQNRQSF